MLLRFSNIAGIHAPQENAKVMEEKFTAKEKIKMALAIIGIIAGCAILLKLIHMFMWACYDAGIPM